MRDLRRFLRLLEESNELAKVTAEVGLDGELAAVQHEALRRDGPALLFENIAGHSGSWCRRILTGELGAIRRVALMLGMSADADFTQVAHKVASAFSSPLPPVLVESGPVKENIYRGAQVDIRSIPAPIWHPRDGGPYINTWCGVVTRDPETLVHNVGIYRGQVLGPNLIGVKLMTSKGWGAHFAKHRASGTPMPVSVFYGGDPTLGFMAGCPLPEPPEYDVAGAMMGAPVRLVKCETNDLLVPADAEIVVEGHIPPSPDTFLTEGPFGEWTGRYSIPQKSPVIHVECITHRNDPIFRGCLACTESTVPRESAVTGRIGQTAIVWHILDRSRVEGVLDVETGPRRVPALVVAKVDRRTPDQPMQVARALWSQTLNMRPISTVMVVNGDVDIHSLDSLLNHLSRLAYFGRTLRVLIQEGGVGAQTTAPNGSEAGPADRDAGPGDLKGGLRESARQRVLLDATLVPEADMSEDERKRHEAGEECLGAWGELSERVRRNWARYRIG